jgi:hypothetical protein
MSRVHYSVKQYSKHDRPQQTAYTYYKWRNYQHKILALKMDTIRSSETLVPTYRTARRYNPQHKHRYKYEI